MSKQFNLPELDSNQGVETKIKLSLGASHFSWCVIAKSMDTYANVIFQFFLFNKFALCHYGVLSVEHKKKNDFSIGLQCNIKCKKKSEGVWILYECAVSGAGGGGGVSRTGQTQHMKRNTDTENA